MPRLVLDLPAAKMRALARHAELLDCDREELAVVAIEELLAALASPRRAVRRGRPGRPRRQTAVPRRRARQAPVRPARTTSEVSHAEVAPPPAARPASSPASDASASTAAAAPRTYQPKRCPGCGRDFVPTGPRSITCQRCKAEFAASPSLDNADYPNRPGAALS
jgi:hypothetical protein